MVIIFAFAAAVNLHFFWTYEIKQHKTAKYFVSVSKYWSFLTQYWPWITLSFYSLVPSLILISTSTAIVLEIVHSNYVREHSVDISDGGVKLTSMTLTLLSVSFVFLLATGPYAIFRYGSLYYYFNTRFCLYLIEDKDKKCTNMKRIGLGLKFYNVDLPYENFMTHFMGYQQFGFSFYF